MGLGGLSDNPVLLLRKFALHFILSEADLNEWELDFDDLELDEGLGRFGSENTVPLTSITQEALFPWLFNLKRTSPCGSEPPLFLERSWGAFVSISLLREDFGGDGHMRECLSPLRIDDGGYKYVEDLMDLKEPESEVDDIGHRDRDSQ